MPYLNFKVWNCSCGLLQEYLDHKLSQDARVILYSYGLCHSPKLLM